MKAHDLIHDGLYLIGDSQIVRFYALNGAFYTLDDDFFGNPFEKAESGEIECFTINKNWLIISPIPLTPEILGKNGWVTDGHTWWRNDEGFSISGEYYRRKSGEPLYISITGEATCDLNHVHTLQHALRLCGLHDLADNFKV